MTGNSQPLALIFIYTITTKRIQICAIFFTLVCNHSIAQQADLIITNANIITAVEKGHRKQAVAIKDGLIFFCGDQQ